MIPPTRLDMYFVHDGVPSFAVQNDAYVFMKQSFFWTDFVQIREAHKFRRMLSTITMETCTSNLFLWLSVSITEFAFDFNVHHFISCTNLKLEHEAPGHKNEQWAVTFRNTSLNQTHLISRQQLPDGKCFCIDYGEYKSNAKFNNETLNSNCKNSSFLHPLICWLIHAQTNDFRNLTGTATG